MSRLNDPFIAWAVGLLNYTDPDQTRQRIVMQDDSMQHQADRASLERAIVVLNGLVTDDGVSNADLKGLLNRASAGSWGAEYERSYAPRTFVEDLGTALKEYLRRNPKLR